MSDKEPTPEPKKRGPKRLPKVKPLQEVYKGLAPRKRTRTKEERARQERVVLLFCAVRCYHLTR